MINQTITIDDSEKIKYYAQTEDANERLLKVPEVCELLSVSRSYLYWLTSEKKIPHIKMHGHLRFRRSAIEEWLRSQERMVRSVSKET